MRLAAMARRLGRPLRDAAARRMMSLPFDSTLVGPPRRAVDNLVSWLAENPDQGRILAVDPGEAFDFGSIEGDDPLGFVRTRYYQHPPTFVARLHRARVAGAVPTVITGNDAIVRESIHCAAYYWPWTDLDVRVLLPRIHDVPEPLIVLSYALSTGLHEWLLYALPRFLLAEKAGATRGATVLVPPHAPPWLFGSLQLAGVPQSDLRHFAGDHWRAPSVVLPSVPSERPLPWAVNWLRASADRSGLRAPKAGLRLYVSRRSALTRRVANEPEVTRWFEARGFRCVDLADLPFSEQVLLASSASVIVGPHGAGLTYALFAKPGCLLAEVVEPSYPFACYYWLAGASGHRYRYAVAETVRQAGYGGNHGFDMRVSIQSLERLLQGVD